MGLKAEERLRVWDERFNSMLYADAAKGYKMVAEEAIALLRDCPIKYFDFSGYEGEGAEWLRKREAFLEGGDERDT